MQGQSGLCTLRTGQAMKQRALMALASRLTLSASALRWHSTCIHFGAQFEAQFGAVNRYVYSIGLDGHTRVSALRSPYRCTCIHAPLWPMSHSWSGARGGVQNIAYGEVYGETNKNCYTRNRYAMIHVEHEIEQSRFTATVEDNLCVLDYQLHANTMAIVHTGVPPALAGRGIAAELTRVALDTARAEGWKVQPLCSYAAIYMRRHPQYNDILA